MKNTKIGSFIARFATPVLLIALGVILLFNPDAVTVAVTKIIGYILLAAGLFNGVYALFTWPSGRVSRVATVVICLAAGGFLLLRPLFLAENLSRFLGILLALEAGQNLFQGYGSKIMGIVTLAIAAVLVFLPMAASRLVFTLCSLVLIAVGLVQLLDRIRNNRLDSGNSDPDIIDAL